MKSLMCTTVLLYILFIYILFYLEAWQAFLKNDQDRMDLVLYHSLKIMSQKIIVIFLEYV